LSRDRAGFEITLKSINATCTRWEDAHNSSDWDAEKRHEKRLQVKLTKLATYAPNAEQAREAFMVADSLKAGTSKEKKKVMTHIKTRIKTLKWSGRAIGAGALAVPAAVGAVGGHIVNTMDQYGQPLEGL
jgi:hypothetical protein